MEIETIKKRLAQLKQQTKEKSEQLSQRDISFNTNSNSNSSLVTTKNCSINTTKNNCSMTTGLKNNFLIPAKNNSTMNSTINKNNLTANSTTAIKTNSISLVNNNKPDSSLKNTVIKNESQISINKELHYVKKESNKVQSVKPSTAGDDNKKHICINNKYYTILNNIGKGGSSVVYQALNEKTKALVAIKCVDLSRADDVIREAYENEIKLLEKLQGSPRVIKIQRTKTKLFVVLECGERDLLTRMQESPEDIDDTFIKYYWQEMLRCVKVIHDRNIVHSDLKPSNFLFVGARLKLIDFGIATNIPSNLTSAVKDFQIGTLNYMSPEAINGSYTTADGSIIYKIPLKSDVWSLGCILYAMVYGRTPFQSIANQLAKLNAIMNESHEIQFPPIRDQLLLNVLKKCLVRNVRERPSVDDLLNDPYLTE